MEVLKKQSGPLVLEYDKIHVDEGIASQLKPHQVEGIKFMFDVCFESSDRLTESIGKGCILAHGMGLGKYYYITHLIRYIIHILHIYFFIVILMHSITGKSLQIISLTQALITHNIYSLVETVLIISPVNTISNWYNEFKKWFKYCKQPTKIRIRTLLE